MLRSFVRYRSSLFSLSTRLLSATETPSPTAVPLPPDRIPAGPSKHRKCYNCGEMGHVSANCTNTTARAIVADPNACFKCGDTRHIARHCTKPIGGRARCHVHGRTRLVHLLVENETTGQWSCTEKDPCQTPQAIVGHKQRPNAMLCGVHNVHRGIAHLSYGADETWSCKPGHECTVPDPIEAPCSLHPGKNRKTKFMDRLPGGTWRCKLDSMCEQETATCSLHGTKRFARYLRKMPDGNFVCSPQSECERRWKW